MRQWLVGPEYDAYESLSVSTAAVGFTAATLDDRQAAFVTCETAAVRFRMDGTDPTASVGHEIEPGDTLTLDSNQQLRKIKFISRDGGTATLRCSFGR